jgi:hypothetical protein
MKPHNRIPGRPFWLTLALILGGWFTTTWSTRHAPAADGAILYGFPLPFGWEGGMCGANPTQHFAGGYCPFTISAPFLAVDLLLLVCIPILVQKISNGIVRRRNRTRP